MDDSTKKIRFRLILILKMTIRQLARCSTRRKISYKILLAKASTRLSCHMMTYTKIKLTTDSWILQAVKGYKLKIPLEHIQRRLPGRIHFSPAEKQLIDIEIQKLLE